MSLTTYRQQRIRFIDQTSASNPSSSTWKLKLPSLNPKPDSFKDESSDSQVKTSLPESKPDDPRAEVSGFEEESSDFTLQSCESEED